MQALGFYQRVQLHVFLDSPQWERRCKIDGQLAWQQQQARDQSGCWLQKRASSASTHLGTWRNILSRAKAVQQQPWSLLKAAFPTLSLVEKKSQAWLSPFSVFTLCFNKKRRQQYKQQKKSVHFRILLSLLMLFFCVVLDSKFFPLFPSAKCRRRRSSKG